VRARTARRRELRAGITTRTKLVELLLGVHADVPPCVPLTDEGPAPPAPRLKRYRNE
jgi:hypothetical protein